MKAHSLRLRLLLGAAVAIFVALAVAWVAMTWLFEQHLQQQVVGDLMRDARPLLANLALSATDKPVAPHAPIDARFKNPGSGLYWQLTTAAGNLRSRSLWDQELPRSSQAVANRWTTRLAPGPFGNHLLVLERRVRVGSAQVPVLVQLAHEDATLKQARAVFGRELIRFLAVLWLVLSIAAALQVRLGLYPLRRVRRELMALRGDPAARLGGDHPREIQPLSNAINELAQAREQDLARARRRAADLAHSLKTPLAALAAQSRLARRAGAVAAADGLDRVIATVGTAINAELARARVAGARRHRAISPLRTAERLVGVVEHTPDGTQLGFEIDIPPALRVPVDEDDLMELLGALIENAARHARHRVCIAGAISRDVAVLAVEDDGPGLDPAVQRRLEAGHRLDETGPGHQGLGLVIARDVIAATGGHFELGHSSLGGLRVVMRWPVADATAL